MYVASCLVEQPITGKALATGYPLANTHIFILDEGLNPLPVGEPCHSFEVFLIKCKLASAVAAGEMADC